MNLFRTGNFVLHSGGSSPFLIDCTALSYEDWDTVARMTAYRFSFSGAIGVPEGGVHFAKALKNYISIYPLQPLLIVDDVLTTGHSMNEIRRKILESGEVRKIIGVVLFARGTWPEWIHPIFRMWPRGTQWGIGRKSNGQTPPGIQ